MNYLPTPKLPVWNTAVDPLDEETLEQQEYAFSGQLQRVRRRF